MRVLLLVGFWLMMIYGTSVNGYPREDLVDRLPGQPKVGFKQYAGYVNVDEQSGRSLFYYFVEAQKDANNHPLTLWLNGGPGCSSVGAGAFSELGPFFPTGDGRGLRLNSESWNKASNILFIESPAGVGWSYSNTTSDYTRGDDLTAQDLVTFFLRWFEKFPDFKSTSLFLAGESYAGHYIPQLANLLLDYNHQSNDFKFNIKGLAIGNPLLNWGKEYPDIYEYYWSHGMISDEIWEIISRECNDDDINVSASCNEARKNAAYIIGYYINRYDIILDVCYPSIVQQELRLRQFVTHISVGVDVCITQEGSFYFNLPEVQMALHANRTNLPYIWSLCSKVLNYTRVDGERNILPILQRIIQNNIPLWIFSGDEDSVLPLIGTRTLVRELAKDLNFQTTVPYGPWFHKGQVGGWQIEYGNMLTFVTVRGAAHMVPYSQPSRALHLFSDFVRGRRLPNTTKTPIYDY